MPTLKEIKARIGSVQSTLKITSAMKLVSSAKLRKAQNAIEAMRPYEQQLQRILTSLTSGKTPENPDSMAQMDLLSGKMPENPDGGAAGPTVIIAIASNSSLCGGFNANAVAAVREIRRPGDTVYSIGRKMADAMRRDGFASPADYSALSEHPSYAPAADLVEKLAEELADGKISRVLLVYNHFYSSAKQRPVVEQLLPMALSPLDPHQDAAPVQAAATPGETEESPDLIIEPSAREVLEMLLPKTLKLKLFAALLDSAAAEHAARTIAMQTATDNGEDLLAELTLQYNKGRQQKITAEILDLAGGQQ